MYIAGGAITPLMGRKKEEGATGYRALEELNQLIGAVGGPAMDRPSLPNLNAAPVSNLNQPINSGRYLRVCAAIAHP